MSFAYVLLALNLLGVRQVPTGTQLHVRLLTPIGSYASRAGDPVKAVLIAPVYLPSGTFVPEETGADAAAQADPEQTAVLPAGSILMGHLKSVQRVGFGFIHENAALDLTFDDITLPNGETVPLSSRVLAVDNGRERVAKDGSIRAGRATNTLSYRVSGYVRTAMQWEFHAALTVWAIKTLLVQVPESEIYYPPGVELTLILTGQVKLPPPLVAETGGGPDEGLTARRSVPAAFGVEERAQIEELISTFPFRTHTPLTNRDSDLVNLTFIGSRRQISAAFEAAGWNQPAGANMRTNIRRIRAVAEGRGDVEAPISTLLLNGSSPDMAWQKSFNDVSKRHHIRIWKQTDLADGREIWVGAATRDIDFAYLRPGWAVTHKIEENIDRERTKVINDLIFTSCVGQMDEFDRTQVPGSGFNATGDPISTDTRLAVVGLGPCSTGLEQGDDGSVLRASAAAPLRRHGNRVQRFARREVLCLRSDLLRENPYWRGYEGIRFLVAAIRDRRQHSADPQIYAQAYSREGQLAARARPYFDMFR